LTAYLLLFTPIQAPSAGSSDHLMVGRISHPSYYQPSGAPARLGEEENPMVATVSPTALAPRTRAFYRQVLGCLGRSSTPFLVGGAYALERYTDISRHTKDLDLFVRPEDCRRVLEILAAGGWRTELTFPHWLGKAFADD